MKLDQILVTTDLSDESDRPVAAIAELARAQGARITLLHVVEDVPAIPRGAALAPPVPSPDIDARMAEARSRLEARTAAFNGATVHSEVIASGTVAETIASYARDRSMDLIAMSTHGRTGFRRMALGSVAEEVVRRATVPVIVFPRADA